MAAYRLAFSSRCCLSASCAHLRHFPIMRRMRSLVWLSMSARPPALAAD